MVNEKQTHERERPDTPSLKEVVAEPGPDGRDLKGPHFQCCVSPILSFQQSLLRLGHSGPTEKKQNKTQHNSNKSLNFQLLKNYQTGCKTDFLVLYLVERDLQRGKGQGGKKGRVMNGEGEGTKSGIVLDWVGVEIREP